MATNNGNKTVNECFIEACKERNSENVKAAIKLGCDINWSDTETNFTGLGISVGPHFSLDIMEIILQAPAVNVNNVCSPKPAHYDYVQTYPEMDTPINYYSDDDDDYVYGQHVVQNNSYRPRVTPYGDTTRRARQPNLDVNKSAVHVACDFNKPQAIKRLARVPNLEVNKSADGKSAMMIAVDKGHLDCLKELILIPGIDFNDRNCGGEAPIIFALKKGNMEIFNFLAEIPEINLKVMDTKNKTLEQLAREMNRTEYLRFIPGTTENQVDVLTKQVQMLVAAKAVPDCPVCFNPLRSPTQMFQCGSGHIVCGNCKPRIQVCPTCRERMTGRAHHFEKFLKGEPL